MYKVSKKASEEPKYFEFEDAEGNIRKLPSAARLDILQLRSIAKTVEKDPFLIFDVVDELEEGASKAFEGIPVAELGGLIEAWSAGMAQEKK